MEWLSQIIDWVLDWFPELLLVRPTERGVKYRGGKIYEVKPGLSWFWPVVSEVDVFLTARHSLDLPAQALTTKDGKSVTVSGVLVIEISDVLKAGQIGDYEDTITEIGGAALVSCITSRSFKQSCAELDTAVWTEFTKDARSLLRKFGVRVIAGYTTDFAQTQVIRLVGGTILAGDDE